jgi:hypothetical protein
VEASRKAVDAYRRLVHGSPVLPARIAATDLFRQIGEYVVGADALRAHGLGAAHQGAVREIRRLRAGQELASWFAGASKWLVDRIE